MAFGTAARRDLIFLDHAASRPWIAGHPYVEHRVDVLSFLDLISLCGSFLFLRTLHGSREWCHDESCKAKAVEIGYGSIVRNGKVLGISQD